MNPEHITKQRASVIQHSSLVINSPCSLCLLLFNASFWVK
jgi:hypothetical protein